VAAERCRRGFSRGEASTGATGRGRGALFVTWGNEAIEFWAGAQKLTLNPALYAVHRTKVVKRLSADAADYIAAIDLA
jgi:hypothetical protein